MAINPTWPDNGENPWGDELRDGLEIIVDAVNELQESIPDMVAEAIEDADIPAIAEAAVISALSDSPLGYRLVAFTPSTGTTLAAVDGTPTFTASGHSGANAMNSSASVGVPAGTIPAGRKYTAEVWVRRSSNAATSNFLNVGGLSAPSTVLSVNASGEIRIRVDSSGPKVFTGTSFPLSSWNHLAVAIDTQVTGANQAIIIPEGVWLNGTPLTIPSISPLATLWDGGAVFGGATGGQTWNGTSDDYRISRGIRYPIGSSFTPPRDTRI